MKYFYFCLFTFAFLLSSACRPAAAPVSISNQPVSINDIPQTNVPMSPLKPLGEMTWTKSDGTEEKLKDFRGKVVVLDFWATYCPPCIKAIPHLNDLQAKYGADNLQIIGLNVGGEEDLPKVPAFAEKYQINYTLATPEDALMRFIFGKETAIPQTAIFDRNGKFIEKFVGFDDTIQKNLDAVIEQVVNSGN